MVESLETVFTHLPTGRDITLQPKAKKAKGEGKPSSEVEEQPPSKAGGSAAVFADGPAGVIYLRQSPSSAGEPSAFAAAGEPSAASAPARAVIADPVALVAREINRLLPRRLANELPLREALGAPTPKAISAILDGAGKESMERGRKEGSV